MTTFGLTRDSETPPTIDEQKSYIEGQGFAIDAQDWFLVSKESTRASRKKWRETLFGTLQEGDTLVCFNLASFGGTIGYIVDLVDALLDKNVFVQLIEEKLLLTSRNHSGVFRLLAQAENELLAERTRKSVRVIKQSGSQQGRIAGSTSKSKLDPHKKEIQALLKRGESLKSIARVYGCSDTAVRHFIKTRKLKMNGPIAL